VATRKTWRHAGGTIRDMADGLVADVWHLGRRYRARVETVEKGRGWIEAKLRELTSNVHPFSPQETAAIRSAMEILPAGVTIMQACAAYSMHQAAAQIIEMPVIKARAQYITERQSENLRPRTMATMRWVLGKYLPRDATWPSAANMLAILPANPRTRINAIRVLQPFFAWAVTHSYCASNPVADLGRPVLNETVPQILTVTQARALLAAAVAKYPSLVPYLAIGMFSGLRTSELQELLWSDVTPTHLTIRPEVAKSRRARYVPICANLTAWLSGRAGRPGKLVADKRWKQLAQDLRDCRTAAGIYTWPHNAMRHSFGSYHLALHQDWARTAFLMGHSGGTDVLAHHYRQLVTTAAAREYFDILPEGSGATQNRK
jgi:site-specific recombinase XerD